MGRTLPEVSPGSTVQLQREDGQRFRFVLVPSVEADVGEGKLSVAAPLGKALLGKRPGDEFTYEAPAGPVKVKVLEVEPPGA